MVTHYTEKNIVLCYFPAKYDIFPERGKAYKKFITENFIFFFVVKGYLFTFAVLTGKIN